MIKGILFLYCSVHQSLCDMCHTMFLCRFCKCFSLKKHASVKVCVCICMFVIRVGIHCFDGEEIVMLLMLTHVFYFKFLNATERE